MVFSHQRQGWWWRAADNIRHFWVWLIYDGTIAIYHSWQAIAGSFESQLAVVITAKNITKPLYQDYTREGRLIGLIIRLGRILVGIVIQLLIAIIYLTFAIVWLALPFFLVWQLVRNLVP
ncbi:MAG: hypothetical protein Q7S64_02545 [bacterium]|nr:hypothetical protein [bacterium]